MLPVSCLPICGLLMGLGYFLCPSAIQGGTISGVKDQIGYFLITAGGAPLNHIALLFAIGVGVGLSDGHDGTGAIAAFVSWLVITALLSTGTVTALFPGLMEDADSLLAFSKIENPFIGILSGMIGSSCYNRFKDKRLPDWLSFFSGKRFVAMAAGVLSILAAAALLIIWPLLFKGLIALGASIAGLGNFGAALYAFLNRLLIPTGLHHALNNVFWFDTIGLGDLTHFWAGDTSADVTWSLGMYMSGFFPAMMFGVPGAALAIVRSAKPEKKKAVMGIMLSSAVCAFVCGVTEPFEFAFMFLSPVLYLFYALLYGVVTFVALASGFRAGFSFSGGVTDLIFSSSLPAAARTYMILPLGLLAFVLFYAVFRFFILKWDLKTPGREAEAAAPPGAKAKRAVSDCARQAGMILKGLGGAENVVSIDHCVTRLRLELKDASKIDEAAILAAGAPGVIRIGKSTVQVVVGTSVQFVAEELQKLCASVPVGTREAPDVQDASVPAGAEEARDEQGASASADPKEAAGTRAHRMISHLDDIFTDPVTDGGFDFVMTRAEGIHARPAGAIAKMAAAYDCEITVSADGRTCSARQMTELMALGTSKGTAVHVRAAGNDAASALSALKAYMEENL